MAGQSLAAARGTYVDGHRRLGRDNANGTSRLESLSTARRGCLENVWTHLDPSGRVRAGDWEHDQGSLANMELLRRAGGDDNEGELWIDEMAPGAQSALIVAKDHQQPLLITSDKLPLTR